MWDWKLRKWQIQCESIWYVGLSYAINAVESGKLYSEAIGRDDIWEDNKESKWYKKQSLVEIVEIELEKRSKEHVLWLAEWENKELG